MIEAGIVIVAAFVAGVLLYPPLVSLLVRRGVGQHVAEYSPATHRLKEGTPTLGGVLFCAIALAAWLILDRSRVGFVAIFALLGGAGLGALDDAINITSSKRLGLGAWNRVAVEAAVGVCIGVGLAVTGLTHQYFPGLGAPNLGWGIVPLAALATIAVSNAVNLTDGVDGLAASCMAVVLFGITFIAAPAHEMHPAIVAAALTGALAAFLVFNWHPARIFMGDTGSLALGAVLVALAAEVHLLWALPLLGIVFLVETLSVIVNVTAIRRFGIHIFRASPLHHHFEELGLREQRLVASFAAVAALATLFTVLLTHIAGPAS
ncbi:MAG TPA: phospho-N-acetylmuramoyl-pentapeptide-transferase [Candidatus Dormibacteraeota bacterium]